MPQAQRQQLQQVAVFRRRLATAVLSRTHPPDPPLCNMYYPLIAILGAEKCLYDRDKQQFLQTQMFKQW